MNLKESSGEELVFRLGRRERLLLEQLLTLFPQMPEGYSRLGSGSDQPADPDAQQLLEEALAEHRAKGRVFAQTLLQRIESRRTDFILRLKRAEAETLLQVLNDIRVGSWVALGSPEEPPDPEAVNEDTLPHFWALELSGYFQFHLLKALQGRHPQG